MSLFVAGNMCGAVFVCAMRMPSSLKILHICNLWESRTMNRYYLVSSKEMWIQDRKIDLKQCTFCQIVILMHLVLVRIRTYLGLLPETHPIKGYEYLRYIQTKIPVKHGEHRSKLMVT